MTWRELFVLWIGHGGLCGITLPLWLRILWENRFAIDPPYWVRGCAVTACSVPNSLIAALEEWIYGRRIRQATVEAPLFILGSWRSGTTHLHNLFAQVSGLPGRTSSRCSIPGLFFSLAGSISR
jgi:hypothetical protein